jgi:hypothetical protein
MGHDLIGQVLIGHDLTVSSSTRLPAGAVASWVMPHYLLAGSLSPPARAVR